MLSQPISTDVLIEKYAKDGEYEPDQIFQRVAKGLSAVEDLSIRTDICLLYTSPSPRDRTRSRMPSSA